jgi:RNA polymerase sigma factor (sigma-70 family)
LSEISAQVKKYAADYEAQKGIKPSVKQIATDLGLLEEDVVQALEVGGTVSLDGMATGEDGENTSLYGLIADDEDKYEDFETKETLRVAMQDFSDTEKALVKYRYMDELSQSETAKRLGVSQMFVSRMERKLLLKLKEKLQDSM